MTRNVTAPLGTAPTATGPLALPARRWVAFTTGIVVGMATGLVGVGIAVAAERARRRAAGDDCGPRAGREQPRARRAQVPQAPVVYPPAAQFEPSPSEAELDEELAQTFPASDPLPYSHRVD
ncbi:MAG TPA: hypothetical protein VHX52_01085 [Steroidobacteraceae bacterium]|jgi:hypothetical protein|nr:hypothetical protein [Steroidobacteraceae bacterium]